MTAEQVKASIRVVQAIADAIRDLKQIPSGHLYGRLMGHLSLQDYERIIDVLVNAGVVREDPSHLLVWIG